MKGKNNNVRILIGRAILIGCMALLTNVSVADPHHDEHGHEHQHQIDDAKWWPKYGHDYANTNWNPEEENISPDTAKYLRRAWETFNDDTLVTEPRPSGFALESMLNLVYRSAVVGVVSGPLIDKGTLYYVDELGTVFARDSKTGGISDHVRHWTTTLVDPDFDNNPMAPMPELTYTAPTLTKRHIWVVGSGYGKLHAIEREGGAEVDFDASTPEVDPYDIASDLPFSSVLGDSVIVNTGPRHGDRTLYITGINVVINDSLTGNKETGLLLALDITDPEHPFEVWRTPTIDINPETGRPFSTGVSAGSGLSVDPERGLIYGGMGQNTSVPYGGFPNKNLAPPGYVNRGDSLYALDYLTGQYVWLNTFHEDDVFDPSHPVSTGPNPVRGVRDADVLAPPVLYTIKTRKNGRKIKQDVVADGSKGGRFRAVDRDTGETIWERDALNKQTGIGGMQAGAAYANGNIYVATFEGIDDAWSDIQFGVSFDTGIYPNAFFATFSPAFWSDVEFTEDDGDPTTGVRTLVYSLDGETGYSNWDFGNGIDYVELPGASMRHVTVANGLLYITLSSGRLYVLDEKNGGILFEDQTPDLNALHGLGLPRPQHASMNGGSIVSDGMLYVPYGGQNEPSGGMLAYEVNEKPKANRDVSVSMHDETAVIRPLKNDLDPNGDALRFSEVSGVVINTSDGEPDVITLSNGVLEVYNPGDDQQRPDHAYIKFMPREGYSGRFKLKYEVTDIAPDRIVNGQRLVGEPNQTHVARSDDSKINFYVLSGHGRKHDREVRKFLRKKIADSDDDNYMITESAERFLNLDKERH